MRLFWTIISIILIYQVIIVTGVFSPNLYRSLFTKPIETYQYIFAQETQPAPDFFYMPERNDKKGVTVHNSNKSYQGYTFMVSSDKNKAYLVDMDGNEVYSWEKSPSDIWGQDVDTDSEILYFWMRSTLNPETGDILVNPFTLDIFSENYKGMTRLDKNSNLVWQSDVRTHHDIHRQPDGTIYALAGDYKEEPNPDLPNIQPPYIDDCFVILSPDGKLVKKLSYIDLFKNSGLSFVVDRLSSAPSDYALPPGDLFHSNSVAVVSKEAAGKAPMLKEGHVLISFRNLDLLAMLDPVAEKITWASYGPFKGQHSPQILDDGSVILFDNLGNLKQGGHSRILRLNLDDMRIMWEYSGTDENPLWSWHSSHVQALPNGNILVTEAQGGRVFEISPDKEIVWEYWLPERYDFVGDGQQQIPVVFSGKRFTKDELKFLDLE